MKKVILGALKYFVKDDNGKCAAVILAAGSSSRMNGVNKIYAELSGMPLLAHTLAAFENADCISEIVVVASTADLERTAALCSDYAFVKVKCVVAGGAERAMSSMIGIRAVSDNIGLIAIHDGARPLVSGRVIADAVSSARLYATGVAAIPVNSTLKRVADGAVCGSVDRSNVYEMQTPQVFQAELITAAMENAIKKGIDITDDSSAVEAAGIPVRITAGSFDNIKVTTQADLSAAALILRARGYRT